METLLNLEHLSGRSRRKLLRLNTIHLRGLCPVCGDQTVRFYKEIVFNGKANQHNKWYCKKCHNTFDRKDLEYVKYV